MDSHLSSNACLFIGHSKSHFMILNKTRFLETDWLKVSIKSTDESISMANIRGENVKNVRLLYFLLVIHSQSHESRSPTIFIAISRIKRNPRYCLWFPFHLIHHFRFICFHFILCVAMFTKLSIQNTPIESENSRTGARKWRKCKWIRLNVQVKIQNFLLETSSRVINMIRRGTRNENFQQQVKKKTCNFTVQFKNAS